MKTIRTAIICGTVLFAVLILAFALHRPRYAQAPTPWGVGYDSTQGYMQPDHSAFYYWMAYNMLWQNPTPTYHVYVPPAGYPASYRPWQADPIRPTYGGSQPTYTGAQTPARTSGGFSPRVVGDDQPAYSGAQTPARTSGGFSQAPSAPPSTSRTSGGFSSAPPSRPSTTSSPSRTSGGFGSSSSSSSSSRTSGGFSKRK